jgi:glucose-1-phosphate adenylyltransferase
LEGELTLACPIMQIVNKDDVEEAARESDGYFIKSGIVTIIKDAVIPNGTII